MLLDGYWKKELNGIKRHLSIWSRSSFFCPQNYAEHRINQGLLYSAVIIRKITEDERDAEKALKKHQMPMPELPILKISVPVMRSQHNDEDNLFANSKVFLGDYDLQNGQADSMSLKEVCNQIIHSYAWAVVHRGKNRIHGVLVASDREKETDIIMLSVSDWISAIQEVIEKSTI